MLMKAKDVLQSLQQGLVICDRRGCVVYCNEAYSNFVEHTLKEMYGQPLKSFRPGALVPKVLQTKRAIEGVYRQENTQEYFANIYPIMENGYIQGTVSIITTMEQERLEEETRCLTLKERVNNFERQQIQKMLAVYGDTVEGKKRAAKELGISLSTLYEKLAKET